MEKTPPASTAAADSSPFEAEASTLDFEEQQQPAQDVDAPVGVMPGASPAIEDTTTTSTESAAATTSPSTVTDEETTVVFPTPTKEVSGASPAVGDSTTPSLLDATDLSEERADQLTADQAPASTDLLPAPSADAEEVDTTKVKEVKDEDLGGQESTMSKTLPPMSIWIVTTASLPWRTGTAVNPLWRALSLIEPCKNEVTLMIPWLRDADDQQAVYGKRFASRSEQEEWIRNYCREQTNNGSASYLLLLEFYDAVFKPALGCIFPVEDLCARISAGVDVVILEEPEHLNWFYCPDPSASEDDDSKQQRPLVWTQKFRHVVGILHTNYGAYLQEYTTVSHDDSTENGGPGRFFQTKSLLNSYSALVLRAYCDVVIALSQTLPLFLDDGRQVTCNVHGVRSEFFDPPAATPPRTLMTPPPAQVYFVGKLVWAKGFEYVLQVQDRFNAAHGEYFDMDVYGAGKDQEEIERAFLGRNIENDAETAKRPSLSVSDADQRAAEIFGQPLSLRTQVTESETDVALAAASEITDQSQKDGDDGAATSVPALKSVVSDLGSTTLSTGMETAQAGMSLVESILSEAFGKEKDDYRTFNYVPPRATFKWRQTPIPARFHGVKDHVIVRDLTEQKIFLNMSTSEVLCTTSAEALAMGKFVILPRHPSNVFFYQFPNCLVYKDLDDCVIKLKYALTHDPEPLTKEYAYMLTWEGATERLYTAARFSQAVEKRNRAPHQDFDMEKATKMHVGITKRSQFVGKLLSLGNESIVLNEP